MAVHGYQMDAKMHARYKITITVVTLLLLLFNRIALADPLTLGQLQARLKSGELDPNPLFFNDEERRVAFANVQSIFPTRAIPASENPVPLSPEARDFDSITFEVKQAGAQVESPNEVTVSLDVEAFLQDPSLLGLIVVKDGKVLLEHYAADHGPDVPWVTFSVSKSITSLLIGAAVEDGFIPSINDPVEYYLPRLRGSDYGKVPVHDILQMASGIAWNEDYEDPESDVAIAGALNGIPLTNHLAKLPSEHKPGTAFNYNTGEANLAGEILRSAVGNAAANYLAEQIWQGYGMEYPANWLLDRPNGVETGGCCVSATLRDYARIGMFVLDQDSGKAENQILPAGWIADSMTASEGSERYGYFWWLHGDGIVGAHGIFGQMILIDRHSGTIVAAHSNAPKASGSDYGKRLDAAAKAIMKAVRESDK